MLNLVRLSFIAIDNCPASQVSFAYGFVNPFSCTGRRGSTGGYANIHMSSVSEADVHSGAKARPISAQDYVNTHHHQQNDQRPMSMPAHQHSNDGGLPQAVGTDSNGVPISFRQSLDPALRASLKDAEKRLVRFNVSPCCTIFVLLKQWICP